MSPTVEHMSAASAQRLRVDVSSGTIMGTTTIGVEEGTGVLTWRGVPYGKAERFRAPRPMDSWTGERECVAYGNVAPQPTYGPSDKIRGDEDCLNLDIVRPDSPQVLPVVVYLHGGSFIVGSSHEQLLRGHVLVQSMNVVYVSINFRLGALGYLDMRSLGDDCVANPAILDQLLALKWIRHNIERFGGDPNNITLMGESAGGAAALTLMCVPSAAGLFHRVIAQSPPIAAIHSRAQSVLWANELASRLGGEKTLASLRQRPVADIVRAGQSMMWRTRALFYLNSCYAPTVDGTTLFAHPLDVFASGQQHKVPLIVGTNVDETSFAKGFYLRSTARARAADRFLRVFDPQGADAVLAAYDYGARRSDFARLLADGVFWAPSLRVAETHQQVAATWMYRFDFAPALLRWLGLGAMHSSELTSIFGDTSASRMSGLTVFTPRAEIEALRDHMQTMWGNFIHQGDPGATWPQYRLAGDHLPGRATMVFDRENRLIYDPEQNYRQAWSGYDMTEWGTGRPDLLHALGLDTGPTRLGPLEIEGGTL
ncbi:carboxylesterase/lipase family protein [Corynebacterium ulcerans]|uniref:carboxylesterase/lipase family protein n=1 Tax=Corynebacterium ulcerans TaxID=65058 RepID=UPI000C784161|nr:carboxylesterase/lipase family protein [Corynebacterium ulcerans]PLW02385.1 carboxylesterase [Corynebacterium ulcerans]